MLDHLAVAPARASGFKRQVKGQSIATVGRRGKYLIFELDSGNALVIHLRMTGRLTRCQKPPTGDGRKHLRLLFRFTDGFCLAFHDTRRLGKAFVLPESESVAYWERLGPEPLAPSFTGARLKRLLGESQRPVKSFLLDQSRIAGIGNIYADESLFLAGIHPLRAAGGLSGEEAGRLNKSIKSILRSAIALQGSSIDTYRDSGGNRGRFQDSFRVHRRQGDPCPRCGRPVEKIRVGGRGTYFCPGCQH